jgi:NTE family protein
LIFFRRSKKVGIALSGGAARALSHIGVLEVLEGLGVKLHAIAGTSMGAIIGSFYCSGVSLEEMKSYIKSMNWKSFMLFSDLSLSKTGIINGRKIENELRKFLGNRTFDDCRIPFCCVAVDLIRRRKVILNRGSLVEAVRASISIPGFISAAYINDQLLVDGGVVEPIPVESVKTMDINIIIASSLKFQKDSEKYSRLLDINVNGTGKKKSKLFGIQDKKSGNLENKVYKKLSVNKVIDTSFGIMNQELAKNCLKSADIVLESEVGDFGFFDVMNGSKIIQRGVEATQEKIPEIKKKLNLNIR